MATPTHSSQVLVDEGNRAYVVQWIAKYKTVRPNKCLLLLGPCGCGKSTLAELSLAENVYSLVRVNASEYRSKQGLEQQLKDAERVPIKQAILVEDPQRLAPDGGLQVLATFCRKASRLPVVVVCEASKKPSIQSLMSAAEPVVFQPMSARKISQHFDVDLKATCNGDLRQVCLAKNSGFISERDRHVPVSEAAIELLQGVNVQSGLHLYRVDGQSLINIMHANYTKVSSTIAQCSDVSEDLSCADVLTDFTSDMGTDIAGIVGTVQPGQRIRKAPSTLQTDVVWTRASSRLNRMRMLSASKHVFWAAGIELTAESIPLLQQHMLDLIGKEDWEGVRSLAPEATPQQLTSLMRLRLAKSDAVVSRMRRALKKLDGLSKN